MRQSYYDLEKYPKKGDVMVAVAGEDFDITVGKEYIAEECAGVDTFYDCVMIIDDKGVRQAYSIEYLGPSTLENNQDKVKYLKRRIKHAEKRISEIKGDIPDSELSKHFTYHGGWDIGYWEGRKSIYQDMLSELED